MDAVSKLMHQPEKELGDRNGPHDRDKEPNYFFHITSVLIMAQNTHIGKGSDCSCFPVCLFV